MHAFLNLLASNPLILLFAVVAVGFPLGRLRLFGASLGLSAILFAGMAFAVVDPRLRLPDPVYQLGLAIFLYCLGLASAKGFFAAFRGGDALRFNMLAGAAVLMCAVLAGILGRLVGLDSLQVGGLFSGSGGNASALAAVMDQGRVMGLEAKLGGAAIAYALSYPAGILGPMLAFLAARRFLGVDLQAEAKTLPGFRSPDTELEAWTLRVTREAAKGLTKREILESTATTGVMGRILRHAEYLVPTSATRLELEDLVVFVGSPEDLAKIEMFLGERSPHEIDRRGLEAFENHRFFVSNGKLVGRPLLELRLPSGQGAIITRVRRGDAVFVPSGETTLELGDRVRVVALREQRKELAAVFGDSYRVISEGDFLTLGLGLALGLALGQLPIPLPGGMTFKLGISGGPLIAGLLLGRFEQLGGRTFSVSFSTSTALRQFGLVIFLAGAGTAAGSGLVHTTPGQVLSYLCLGTLLAFLVSSVVLLWGHRRRLPLNRLGGVLAGAQTQSSILDFISGQTRNELAAQAYAQVYPLMTILRLLLAQLLLMRF